MRAAPALPAPAFVWPRLPAREDRALLSGNWGVCCMDQMMEGSGKLQTLYGSGGLVGRCCQMLWSSPIGMWGDTSMGLLSAISEFVAPPLKV